MLDALAVLRANDHLRRLLLEYRLLREYEPETLWHDRIMALADLAPKELSRLHGLLLANGWLDIRVMPEAFEQPGRIAQCYRITREGLLALRQSDDWQAMSDPMPEDAIAALAIDGGAVDGAMAEPAMSWMR